MNKYASTFLGFVVQIHIYHWQTKGFASHEALGELYDKIHDLTDSFMESYIGKYGRSETTMSSAFIIDYDPNNAIEKVSEFEQFLVSCDLPDTDLLNIRDEMLGIVHKAQYFLTLS